MISAIGNVGIKQETTVGTAESITASEAIMCVDGKLDLEPDMRERSQVRDVASPFAPIKGGVKAPFSGKFEIKGEGTAGTEYAEMNAILEASGFNGMAVTGKVVRYILDSDLDSINSLTVKKFTDGKYKTSKGVRGNAKFELEPGGIGYVNFEGQGAFEADGDVSVIADADDTVKPPVLLSAEMRLLEIESTTLSEDLDGDGEKLKDGAASNQKFSIGITGTGKAVKMVALRAQAVGTPADETNGLTLTIETDNAGDPSGTPQTNGTAGTISTTEVEDSYHWLYFTFTTAPVLANGTDYHIVITGDYSDDADNCIQFDTDSVAAGDQNCQYYDAAWAALSEENISARVFEADADTVEDTDLLFGNVTLDPGAAVNLRTDCNDDNGYHSANITALVPQVSVEPLEKLNSERDFWDYLESATDLFFTCTVGSSSGNQWIFYITHLKAVEAGSEGDRDGDVTHPLTLQLEEPADFCIEIR